MTIEEFIKLDISVTAKYVYLVLYINHTHIVTNRGIREVTASHRVTSWRCKKELLRAGLLEVVPDSKEMRLICL